MTKPLLILDLDGTLIGTGSPPLPRPGLQKFLKYAFDHFEVALWTAAGESWLQYAMDSVLGDFLSSIDQCFIFMIYQTRKNKHHIKPLNYVWDRFPTYNVNNTLIVDNNPKTYSHNPSSAIFIPTFSDNINDIMLDFLRFHLMDCLKYYHKEHKFPMLIDPEFEYPGGPDGEHVSYDSFQIGALVKLTKSSKTTETDLESKTPNIRKSERKRRRSRRKSHRTTKISHINPY